MKRSLFFFFLLLFPSLGFAKYCPACLKTFQAQTVRGQANVLYNWLNKTISGKIPLKLSDTERLFSKDTTININGKRVAMNVRGAYKFISAVVQEHQKLLESRLEQVIVDENDVVLRYQYITEQKRKVASRFTIPGAKRLPGKYRTLAITVLRFKNHKVESWWEVRYIRRITS